MEMGTHAEAEAMAASLVSFMQAGHPDAHPMTVTAAMAIALGAMVGSMSTLGLTQEGRAGAVLRHLFDMAECRAELAHEA